MVYINSLIETLNNDTFYPTPKHLIDKMLSGVDFRHFKTILEPSAGKGDIAKACIEKNKNQRGNYREDTLDIDCIELDQNLQHILRGEKLRVVHNDFLNFNTYKRYDLIIMNPPFIDGDKHILKALEMQSNGGKIICLLNAETIKNAYSNARKTLLHNLTELNAEIDFLEGTFTNSERTTEVEVALIKVEIPIEKKRDKSYIFDELHKAREEKYKEQEFNEVAQYGFLENLVEQYKIEVEGTVRLGRV